METYARELSSALVQARPDIRFTAFVNRDAVEGPWAESMDVVVVPVSVRRRIEWVRGEQQLLPPLARRAGVDVLHSLASTAPAWGPQRRVVTIYDVIYRIHPEAHSRVRGLGMRVLIPLAARTAHRVITPSQSTADDLTRLLHVHADKIDVIPGGVGSSPVVPTEPSALRSGLDLGDRPIVLSASAKRPHKNLMRLLDAWTLLPAPRPLLVLPGYPTAHEQELRRHAEREGVADDVRFLGWVSPTDLEGLYRVARCFVFPSLYEGFGLPVLEAMARGVPVACSDRGSLREVAGDAARLFDPEQPRTIADAVSELLIDEQLRERLRDAGLRQAARFSWSAAAQATVACYERALETRR
jgi:glycosyltransferase involved in cell wall biosynthesis